MADDNTPPYSRSSSPSPDTLPTPALSTCTDISSRTVSIASSISSTSGRSVSDGNSAGRRKGYMRPQATTFADSAKSRESVMSLGSIAHLQYYFARTGLLDGKGAQLAKSRKPSGSGVAEVATAGSGDMSLLGSPEYAVSDVGLVGSPADRADAGGDWDCQEPFMLPPTVSTYNHRPAYVPPPPDMAVLRRELREALEDARKVLKEAEREHDQSPTSSTSPPSQFPEETSSSPGWYEVQGLHVLDLVTLAIRAAKNYYTAHEQPRRLYSIKSERQLRSGLYNVLDVLKRMATRSFAGGIRPAERDSILAWIADIDELLRTDEDNEKTEQTERERWSWRHGDWTGKERERELLFLQSFDTSPDTLSLWTEPSAELPTPFLQSLQNGIRLVELHNALVRKSRRQFGEIKTYHTDTAKPYRCAENLKYWIKAAELRWEIRLDVNVMGVVQGADDAAWQRFDEAILQWCKGVREEITAEWEQEQRKASSSIPPTLRIDEGYEEGIGVSP